MEADIRLRARVVALRYEAEGFGRRVPGRRCSPLSWSVNSGVLAAAEGVSETCAPCSMDRGILR